jgi:hypothetical protein
VYLGVNQYWNYNIIRAIPAPILFFLSPKSGQKKPPDHPYVLGQSQSYGGADEATRGSDHVHLFDEHQLEDIHPTERAYFVSLIFCVLDNNIRNLSVC